MAKAILQPLYNRLLAAEKQYEADINELDELQKVLVSISKLKRARDENKNYGENVEHLDQLLESYNSELETVLKCTEENRDHGIIFREWANEIQSDLRAHDPLMLSFDLDRESRPRPSEAASSRGTSNILTILKSNGRLKEKEDFRAAMSDGRVFFLTRLAWSLAVMGMFITIGFLSADFWYAQQNVAIQIERSESTPLELPAVTLCSDLQNVPNFAEYPTSNYPGLPLFGISTYIRTSRSSLKPELHVSYPDTFSSFPGSPIEDVIVSEDSEKCLSASTGFDVQREMKSRHWIGSSGALQGFSSALAGTVCIHCFRLGFKKKEILQPYDTSVAAVLSPSIQIKMYKSRMFSACQSTVTRRDPVVDLMFASELLLFAKGLDDRGILDFNGRNYSVLNQTQRGSNTRSQIDFFCNVYFFSGFFYPSLDNASISYRYEAESEEKWVKSGEGPYYTVYSWSEDDPLLHGPNREVLERDTYAISAVRVFAEEASRVNSSRAVLPQTSISVLDSSRAAVFTFKRVNQRGKNSYEVKQARSETLGLSYRVLDEYHIGFDFETFETETILTMATMSWPEFITDVFEFVGLFTGICIFTLIVAPAHSFGLRGGN